MTTKNLWGSLPEFAILRTPETLLREQASEISRISNGLIVGQVLPLSSESQKFAYAFSIKAPALNNYTSTLLQISYGIGFYPVRLMQYIGTYTVFECDNEQDYEGVISEILTSNETRSLVSSLLSHSHSISANPE